MINVKKIFQNSSQTIQIKGVCVISFKLLAFQIKNMINI